MSFDMPYWRPHAADAQYGLSVGMMVSKPVSGPLPFRDHSTTTQTLVHDRFSVLSERFPAEITGIP